MDIADEPRIRRLRLHLGWTQNQMADYLGLTQAAVSGRELSGSEKGPLSRALDALEAEIAAEKHPISAPAEAAR